MTLRELELFYGLCENPHLLNLSKEIGLSQSAISLAIKSLEGKLSEHLFDRIGKKLVLNERGKAFKKKTYPHFLALKDAGSFFKQDKLSGVIKIASSKTIGNFIIPSLVFDFVQENADIAIVKDINNSAQIIDMVEEGNIDIGIIEIDCHAPHIIKEVLGEDRLIVVSSDKNLAQKPLYIDELFDRKWLLREQGSGTRELFLASLGDMKGQIDFIECTEFEEMKTLLFKYPQSITCISEFAVQRELQGEELFEIPVINRDLKRKFYIIYHEQKYKTTLFSAFYDFVKENF